MSTANNFRKDIVNQLIPYFRRDERFYLLVCDMGFGTTDKLTKEYPRRVINCGIMEQGTVGIAAGMSIAGLKPVVYSIVNFLVFRALEQIRNDVILQNTNVKFIATGVNNYFNFLGHSHACGNLDIEIMRLINMPVYDPYTDMRDFSEVVHEWIEDDNSGYIRV